MKMIAGASCLGFIEEIAHAAGADADEHLDELRGRDAEERHAGLAGNRARGQRLAGAWRSDQEHTARQSRAELVVLGRIAQEIDDLRQLLLGLFLAGDIGKRHLRSLRIVLSGPASPEPEDVLLTPRHLPTHEDDQAEEEQDRQETEEKTRQNRAALRLPVDRRRRMPASR